MQSIERAALSLHERGLNVIALEPHRFGFEDSGKRPVMTFKRWTTRPQTAEDAARLIYNHAGNIGALAGVTSDAIDKDAMGYPAFIDCDSPKTFDMVGALMRSTHGQTLISKSYRGGHFYIRTPEPVKTHGFDGGELRGRGAYVAAPPSIHWTGNPYAFIDADAPMPLIDAFPGLTFEPVPAERLPRLAARIIAGDPATIGRYSSRSEVDRALMLSLVNAGCHFERILKLFESSHHDSHLDRMKRDYLKRLEAEYLRACNAGNSQSFNDARAFVERVKIWALNAGTITGNKRTRETDRRVLLAHCDVAFRVGRLEWHLSRRDVEKAARISKPTAAKTMKRLQQSRIVCKAHESQASYAARWTFGAGVSRVTHSHTLPASVCEWVTRDKADPSHYLHHATFEHKCMGRNIARTFCACVEAPLTEAEIADATDFTQRTVSRHLDRLVADGLAAGREGGRWQALPANLDEVAEKYGAIDVQVKRAKRIERERVEHRRQLARRLPPASAHEHFERKPQREI